MPRRGPGISLVESSIHQPVEKHGGSAGADHANENQPKEPEGRSPMGSDKERAEGEGQSKNGVRKPN